MERETIYFTVTGIKDQPSAKNYIITIINMTAHTKDLLPSLFYEIAADNGFLSAWSEGTKTTIQCSVKSEKSDKNIMSFLTNGLFGTGKSIPEVHLPDFTNRHPRYGKIGHHGENLGLLDLRALGEDIAADTFKDAAHQTQREAALGPQIVQIMEEAKANLSDDLRPVLVAFRKLPCVQDMLYKTAVYKGLTAMLQNPSAITDHDVMLIMEHMGKDEAAAAVEKIIVLQK